MGKYLYHLTIETADFLREKPTLSTMTDYHSIWPDQIDKTSYWFRHYFVGKPYITLIGPVMNDTHAIVSVIKGATYYRIIIRTKQDTNMNRIAEDKNVNDFILQLESSGQLHKLDMEHEAKRSRPLRSLSSVIITGIITQPMSDQYNMTRSMRAALMSLYSDIDFKLFKEFSAEVTILSGLEKELLKYDEMGIPKSYKFGVMTIRDGQDTEEQWLSNSEIPEGLNKLLNIIGKPVELKDYQGFAAGLDTKTGESGEMSFASLWQDHEIMYHVAPLMPSKTSDPQQIHRKRYIGNDIVCIVFLEGEHQKFDPTSIRSQFLHVFIVVQLEHVNEKELWRVEVLYHKNVLKFSPPLPSPPVFYDCKDLGAFLLLKLINAENAALKSNKFAIPSNKARIAILDSLIETGIEANQVAKSFGRLGERKHHANGERPKSAGMPQHHLRNHHNFNSNNMTTMNESSDTPELPPSPVPLPSISRSSVLRDLKSLTRRKSSNHGHEEGIKNKAQNFVNCMIGKRNSRTGMPF
ncbi:uncharacterized protein B0P05DRAFT_533312 [Gilbertella persicaria]|uniref:uncharacterized protein n=1 Tax=Gilbertella persicaria TaxID=101096 RepID=UPI00221F16D8|nr:uncharacterized protein B0P05DRAFT_533312 [Gilbertella persicaria]KAI8087007.1 hypothetical protein B0P05DRAFT_533312 [Gilbertella persicaria]